MNTSLTDFKQTVSKTIICGSGTQLLLPYLGRTLEIIPTNTWNIFTLGSIPFVSALRIHELMTYSSFYQKHQDKALAKAALGTLDCFSFCATSVLTGYLINIASTQALVTSTIGIGAYLLFRISLSFFKSLDADTSLPKSQELVSVAQLSQKFADLEKVTENAIQKQNEDIKNKLDEIKTLTSSFDPMLKTITALEKTLEELKSKLENQVLPLPSATSSSTTTSELLTTSRNRTQSPKNKVLSKKSNDDYLKLLQELTKES